MVTVLGAEEGMRRWWKTVEELLEKALEETVGKSSGTEAMARG